MLQNIQIFVIKLFGIKCSLISSIRDLFCFFYIINYASFKFQGHFGNFASFQILGFTTLPSYKNFVREIEEEKEMKAYQITERNAGS